jgi:hypothetical protein
MAEGDIDTGIVWLAPVLAITVAPMLTNMSFIV